MKTNSAFKVAIYCDHWQNGGVEAYLMNLFRFWNLEQLDCELVVSQWETDLYNDELAKLGIPHRVTLSKRYRSPILRVLANLSQMRRLLGAGDYDAAYFNLSNSFTMIYAWMAKRAGIPVRVVHSHCTGIRPGFTYPVKVLAHNLGRALFVSSVTQYFACSELAGRWMFGERLFRDGKVQLINNAVNTAAFALRPEERDQFRTQYGLDGKWVVGTVARFSEEKNPFFLLSSFCVLAKRCPEAFLLWIGEGERMESVQARAKELGIWDRILFFGKTNRVANCLWAMDVFCLPSRFEGNPVSVIEAQAAGCMCLVSDTVTKQCKVSDNVRFLPIDQGADVWAEEMQRSQRVCSPAQAATQVADNGYDASIISIRVQELLGETLRHSSAGFEAVK